MSIERVWQGNDGKYQVKASFVCLFHNKKVKLRKPNGIMIAIPLNLLCSDDIAFIVKQPTESSIEKIQPRLPIHSANSSHCSGDSLVTPTEQHGFMGKTSLEEETTSINQNVELKSKDESIQIIPNCIFSSASAQIKNQAFIPENKRTHILNLPSKIVGLIISYLDLRSRLRLSILNRKLHRIIFKPQVWQTITFHSSYQHLVDDKFYYQMVIYLQQRGHLQKSIKYVYLDSTMITSASILLSIKYLKNMDLISFQKCWSIFTYQLANNLTRLVKYSGHKYPTKISKVILGKVLHRGPITEEEQKNLDSKSFGQDAWFINAALNKLSNKNVTFDVVTCSHCHLGAASQAFTCASCGILPLKKCVTCSPRCDRCGSQMCGLDTCIDPKIKVQIAKCGRCETDLALCNIETNTVCQEARKPCGSCHRLYHVKCRTLDGTYLSNQCISCGVVACPQCELNACSAGCHDQWCRKCVTKAHLGNCKCIIIQGSSNNSSKYMKKRNICGKCKKTCKKCKVDHFCDRCLHLHNLKCV